MDVLLGSFVISCMSCRCALGEILAVIHSWEGSPLFQLPNVLSLVVMALTVVWWSPRALEIACNPF
uniref:Uncharacterized protein n=1 Tax=Anguilla anguilla TaxID=7936 RepID=A0A0E9SAA8_ANGAN